MKEDSGGKIDKCGDPWIATWPKSLEMGHEEEENTSIYLSVAIVSAVWV